MDIQDVPAPEMVHFWYWKVSRRILDVDVKFRILKPAAQSCAPGFGLSNERISV